MLGGKSDAARKASNIKLWQFSNTGKAFQNTSSQEEVIQSENKSYQVLLQNYTDPLVPLYFRFF